ncbi:MAG TPA: efflux RND transporter permease subunit, partial [Longimicrobiales bacterium]|nr:efflux RND transporter permease subunit [Longimicrobiales bacterium]
IPVELLPDTQLPRLQVSAEWPGSSAEVIEAFLTAPLEGAIQQVRGVETITSTSSESGGAVVNVEFARETDMDFARLELSERIASLEPDLPVGSSPPRVTMYIPDEFQDEQQSVLRYTVTGPYILEYLREFIEEHIVPELYHVEGVGVIDVSGGRPRLLEIELDEQKIQSLGLSLQEVSARVSQMEMISEAGAVAAPGGLRYTLAIRERAQSADEISRLPLLTDGGRVVRVSDVARVHDTFDEARQYYRIDGDPAVGMEIYRKPRSNTVAMAAAARARIDELSTALPPGMRIILDSDQSVDIQRQLSDLRNRAGIAALIVLVVLLVFLRSPRAAVIVFATVAFSILITVNVIYFSGLTLNLLTLMGLAMGFGLVVDNAIVVLENVYRRRRGGEDAETAARRGASEVVLPILAATGTTVVVLIPFVYLQGDLRVYYVPLAMVVGISLVASLFVAFTFIPSLGAKLLGGVRPRTDATADVSHAPTSGAVPAARGATTLVAEDRDPAAGAGSAGVRRTPDLLPAMPQSSWIVRVYGGMIRGTLAWPWATVLFVLVLLGGSYHLFDKYVTTGRLWNFGGTLGSYLTININMQRGEELERVDAFARFFEERLEAMPEVERFITRVYAQNASIRVTFPEEYENTNIPLAIKEEM